MNSFLFFCISSVSGTTAAIVSFTFIDISHKYFHLFNQYNITFHSNILHHNSGHLFSLFPSNLPIDSINITSHVIQTLLITVLFTCSFTFHQIFLPAESIQHHIPFKHFSPYFCPLILLLFPKSFHFIDQYNITYHSNTRHNSFIYLFSHFSLNIPLTQSIQYRMPFKHSSTTFCSLVLSFTTKSFHLLNQYNTTCHSNTLHQSSIHLFFHFPSNLSTYSINATSHAIQILFSTVLFTFTIIFLLILPLTQSIEYRISFK